MTLAGAQADTSRGPWGWQVIALVVLAGWVAAAGLAQPALVDPDEPRTAIIAGLMAEHGDWLAPHLPAAFHHDFPHDPVEGDLLAYWDKPPLNFWMVAGAMKVLGPTALAARLPSALALVATVLLVYAAGRFLWGGIAGFLAGVVMALAPLPLAMAHVARMDSLLVALMMAMLLAILRLIYAAPRPWLWVLVLYGAAGLGILTKGPEAVVFPAAAVLVMVVLAGRWRNLLRLRPVVGAVICLAIAAPWYLYMHGRYPPATDGPSMGYLYEFFVRQHLTRAAGSEYEHSRFVPGMLLGLFLVGFMPWTIFLPGACAGLGREGWRQRRERPAVVLLLVWAALVIGAFSLSRTQLPHYILPAFPPVALVMGLYLSRRLAPDDRSRAFRWGMAATTVLGVPLVVGLVVATMRNGSWHPAFWLYVVAAGVLSVLGVTALVRRRNWAVFGYLVAGVAVIATFGFKADPTGFYRTKSMYATVQRMNLEELQPDDGFTAYPYLPYSYAWYLRDKPLIVLPAAGEDPYPEEPAEASLLAELNKPRRTFCSLQKNSMVDKLRPQVRWPIRVVSEKGADVTLIVTEPEPMEKPHEP
jgi:4-amino-4-deoxy-L-arabinose transferase-like glycosyltransferase